MIKKWLSRWRLRRAYRREDVRNIFRLLRELGVLDRYHPIRGMEKVETWHFPNITIFHDYLESALDLVRDEGYTDRLKKDFEKRRQSLDDYLAYNDGRAVDVNEAIVATVTLYLDLFNAIDTHKEERRMYYRRHFSNTHTEMMVLLTSFRLD